MKHNELKIGCFDQPTFLLFLKKKSRIAQELNYYFARSIKFYARKRKEKKVKLKSPLAGEMYLPANIYSNAPLKK